MPPAISKTAEALHRHRFGREGTAHPPPPRRYRMQHRPHQRTGDNIRATSSISSINIFILAKTFGSMPVLRGDRSGVMLQAYWPSSNPAAITRLRDGPAVHEGTTRTGGDHPSHRQPRPGRLPAGRRTFQRLSSPEPHLRQPTGGPRTRPSTACKLRDVRYSPPAVEGSQPFHLGPINLRIARGGSLHRRRERRREDDPDQAAARPLSPQSGEILLNGEPARRPATITASSSEHHLRLLLPLRRPGPGQAGFVAERDRSTATLDNRPQGQRHGRQLQHHRSLHQRKRLALINAWLEELAWSWSSTNGPQTRTRLSAGSSTPNVAGPEAPGQDHHRDQPR